MSLHVLHGSIHLWLWPQAGLCLTVVSRVVLKERPGNLRQAAIQLASPFMALVLERVKDNITLSLGCCPSAYQAVGVIGDNDGS